MNEDGSTLPGASEISHVEMMRENTPEARKEAAKYQAEMYERALLRFMHRTDGDTDLTNAMRDFVVALEKQSMGGDETEPINPQRREKLVGYFQEQAEVIGRVEGL